MKGRQQSSATKAHVHWAKFGRHLSLGQQLCAFRLLKSPLSYVHVMSCCFTLIRFHKPFQHTRHLPSGKRKEKALFSLSLLPEKVECMVFGAGKERPIHSQQLFPCCLHKQTHTHTFSHMETCRSSSATHSLSSLLCPTRAFTANMLLVFNTNSASGALCHVYVWLA